MSPEEAAKFTQSVEDAKQLMHTWQRALIEARDSIPPSFSQQIRDQNAKIDKQNEKMDQLAKDMLPVIKAFTREQNFWEVIKIYAKRVGIVSAIYIALKMAGVDLLKIARQLV